MPADYIVIKNKTVDSEVANALNSNNKAKASRWESYRGFRFVPQEIQDDGTAIVEDLHGNIIRLQRGTYYME